jgi:hypothetical protein
VEVPKRNMRGKFIKQKKNKSWRFSKHRRNMSMRHETEVSLHKKNRRWTISGKKGT